MLNPHQAAAAVANASLWWHLKIGPRPIPKRHVYANTSGNASVDADVRCGYA